jgi:hypothetical protein
MFSRSEMRPGPVGFHPTFPVYARWTTGHPVQQALRASQNVWKTLGKPIWLTVLGQNLARAAFRLI